MKRKFYNSLLVFFLTSQSVYAAFSCFPKNDLKIPEVKFKNNKSFTAGTAMVRTQSNVNEIVQHFKDYWNPILDKKYNKALNFTLDWNNDEVDASTTRDDEDNPIITIYGGLARHPELSDNGLLLILCHELGHHFGGAPKNFRGRSEKRSWSSAEGQADYFATNKCFKRMALDGAVYPMAKSMKNQFCTDTSCDVTTLAALSVGNLFATLRPYWKRPNVNGRSDRTVNITKYGHADPQCRFDTYMAGSRCPVGYDIEFDDQDHRVGSCVKNEDPNASRPECWFSSMKY